MSETRTIERTVEPGKWRIGTEPGAEVLRVFLKGQRNRPWELTRMPDKEFDTYIRRIPNGNATDNVVLRGVPSRWKTEGHIVCIWPAPQHEWKMQFEIRK